MSESPQHPGESPTTFPTLPPFSLSPYRWNYQYTYILGIQITHHEDTFPPCPPHPLPSALHAAGTSTIHPNTPLFLTTFTSDAHRLIAATSYDILDIRRDYIFLQSRDADSVSQRQWLSLQLTEEIIIALFPGYRVLHYPLSIVYRNHEALWYPRGTVGDIWVAVSKRRMECFSEEAGYAVSIAQTLMEQEEIMDPGVEIGFWLVTVRGMRVAVVRVVVRVWWLRILGGCRSDAQESAWVGDMKRGGVTMEVTREFDLYEMEERVELFGILGGLAKVAREVGLEIETEEPGLQGAEEEYEDTEVDTEEDTEVEDTELEDTEIEDPEIEDPEIENEHNDPEADNESNDPEADNESNDQESKNSSPMETDSQH
ncbi:hypothetical protein BZA77DRAFT_297178 [Pyronema omphalodes]|nr:hypothetical protein BZA77DRAFT_297178 [Pyronema omphalodes]